MYIDSTVARETNANELSSNTNLLVSFEDVHVKMSLRACAVRVCVGLWGPDHIAMPPPPTTRSNRPPGQPQSQKGVGWVGGREENRKSKKYTGIQEIQA